MPTRGAPRTQRSTDSRRPSLRGKTLDFRLSVPFSLNPHTRTINGEHSTSTVRRATRAATASRLAPTHIARPLIGDEGIVRVGGAGRSLDHEHNRQLAHLAGHFLVAKGIAGFSPTSAQKES
jgi:hypothetical protein